MVIRIIVNQHISDSRSGVIKTLEFAHIDGLILYNEDFVN